MIKLINGPWNGKEIEDSGADPIRMGICKQKEGSAYCVGTATYIPGDGRKRAFWDENEWHGELIQVISHDS